MSEYSSAPNVWGIVSVILAGATLLVDVVAIAYAWNHTSGYLPRVMAFSFLVAFTATAAGYVGMRRASAGRVSRRGVATTGFALGLVAMGIPLVVAVFMVLFVFAAMFVA